MSEERKKAHGYFGRKDYSLVSTPMITTLVALGVLNILMLLSGTISLISLINALTCARATMINILDQKVMCEVNHVGC